MTFQSKTYLVYCQSNNMTNQIKIFIDQTYKLLHLFKIHYRDPVYDYITTSLCPGSHLDTARFNWPVEHGIRKRLHLFYLTLLLMACSINDNSWGGGVFRTQPMYNEFASPLQKKFAIFYRLIGVFTHI